MGATNNIKGTNISLKLVDKECPNCQQKFTQEEVDDRNFDLWFDNSNDVQLETLEKGYYLSIWIRSIEHENCPDTKLCPNCYGRFLTEKMKKLKPVEPVGTIRTYFLDEYYCQPCWKERNKEKSHE